jgi:predicted phosphodiesterase
MFGKSEKMREDRYTRQVGRALTATFGRAEEEEREVDLREARYVIFSDQHKGARDGADDFRRCERAYNAALGYYFEAGHDLVVLGDAEELWENPPQAVLQSYQHTLALEAEFHRAGRYLRVWGNHDDLWATELAVHTLLHPLFPGLRAHEAIRLKVTDGGRALGTLFLVHGHQGERFSDRWSRLARLPIRYVWPTFQRMTGYSHNTPARDFTLRKRRDVAMYCWSEENPGVVLVAGHTHAPIFGSQPRASGLERRLEEARAALSAAPAGPEARERVGLLRAELEWVAAQENQAFEQQLVPMAQPCYFNTGCCCFIDGHITGIEIVGGQIRLVRWPDREGNPAPAVLEEADLRRIFGAT